MPTYVYQCKKCGHRFELFHSMSDETPRKCPRCGKRAVRVPAAGGGLIFKGSGFYITDYRSSSYKEGAKSEGSGGSAKSEGGGKGESKGKAKKDKPAGGSSSKAGSD